MLIQLLVLITIMAITLVFEKDCDFFRERRLCVSLCTIVLTCFSGFRSWWMGDLIKYYTLYRNVNGPNGMEVIFEKNANIGIRIFFKVMGKIGISYDVCLFIIAAFVAIALGLLIYHYSPSPYWSYLMYISMGFYIFTYSGLKQAIAMAFICLAIMAIFEDDIKLFIVWTGLAVLFHAPALIFIAAYPLAKKKVDRYYFLMVLVAVAAIYIFRNQIIEFATDAYYEEERLYTVTEAIGGRTIMMVLIMVLAAFLRPINVGDEVYSQLFNLMIIAAMIQYFSIYDNVFTRLADYYYQFIVLFIPFMLESGEHQFETNPNPSYDIIYWNRDIYMILGLGITLFALWFYYTNISSGSPIIQDFKFFWQINPYALYGGGV